MKNQNNPALFTLITVFFFWGFFGASNGVFIPFCKTYFQIDQFQAQLVEFAFYGAYFIGALVLFIWSSYSKIDILNNFRQRINNNIEFEFEESKKQVKKIALFRLNELFTK